MSHLAAHRLRPLPALALALTLGAAEAQAPAAPPPERRVEGSRLVSEADPAIAIRVPETAVYLGARRILIDETFDAELHVFVEADSFGLIARFYWVQFETYLPGAPDGRYDYRESNPETVLFDGIEMHMQPGGFRTSTDTIRPGTDHAAFRGLIDAAGYRLPEWVTTLRLAHLFEPSARKELLVIYGEGPDALAETVYEAARAGRPGVTFAEMIPDLIADADARIDLEPR